MTRPQPRTDVERARHELDLTFGLLGGFARKIERFEAAVRAEARRHALDGFAQGDARDVIARHRNHVLTEAAELLLAQRTAVYNDAGRHTAEGLDRARNILLDARRTLDEPAPDRSTARRDMFVDLIREAAEGYLDLLDDPADVDTDELADNILDRLRAARVIDVE